ncbi:unnamed protein product [Linum trigynum]|uniref:Uncharacterized protein n=1 Tax=Linum trigynum TaxID=586398 RepID=A0AAV2FFX5_9ROSI
MLSLCGSLYQQGREGKCRRQKKIRKKGHAIADLEPSNREEGSLELGTTGRRSEEGGLDHQFLVGAERGRRVAMRKGNSSEREREQSGDAERELW